MFKGGLTKGDYLKNHSRPMSSLDDSERKIHHFQHTTLNIILISTNPPFQLEMISNQLFTVSRNLLVKLIYDDFKL